MKKGKCLHQVEKANEATRPHHTLPYPSISAEPSFAPNMPQDVVVNATSGFNFFRKDCKNAEAGNALEIHRPDAGDHPKEKKLTVDCYKRFGLVHDSLACWIIGFGEVEKVCNEDKFEDCTLSGTSNEGKFTTVTCVASIAPKSENCTGPIKPRIQALCC